MDPRTGDGNGWQHCSAGHRHWGKHGAAGLLLTDGDRVLLQKRAAWTHEGGTWSVPGGARDARETVVEAALHEAWEEAAIPAAAVRPIGAFVDDHCGWSYTTVVAETVTPLAPEPVRESDAIAWIPAPDVPRLLLHRGFAASWPAVHPAPRRLTVVVDAANVVGSVPDGWWRDRPGAARRLLARLAPLARDGLPAAKVPATLSAGRLTVLFPEVLVVLEGAARAAGRHPLPAAVDVVAAAGSGDDEIVRQAAAAVDAGRQVVVVSADRGLRGRLRPGVAAVGPSWLP